MRDVQRWRGAILFLAVCLGVVPTAAQNNPTPQSPVNPQELQSELQRQQARIAELERLLKEQSQLLQWLLERLPSLEPRTTLPAGDAPAQGPIPAREAERVSGELDALAEHGKELSEKVGRLEKNNQEINQSVSDKTKGLGNFSFSGDIRLRYEPFFQGGGFVTRHQERARARLNFTGKLSDEIAGGISVATGSLPAPVRDLLFRTPLPIVLLIAGTVLVLWRIARTGRGDRA